MKRLFCCILIGALLCLCAGCEKNSRETVYAMDTVMDLQVWGSESEEGIARIKAMLTSLENTWSAERESSLLSQLNDGNNVNMTGEQKALLAEVEAMSIRTGGAFDPKLLAASRLWGFGTEHAGVPTDKALSDALKEEKWDLGAAVKGYAGQQAVALLEALKVDRALLNLGGNIQTYGEKADGTPWSIGIQNPDGGDYLGVISVTGTASVVTSGDYQRYFEADGIRYHHILDPETGRPANSGLRAVTVVCRDGLTADCLSTALFVLGLEKGFEFWRQSDDFGAVFISADGTISATENVALGGCEYEVICREN